ncbi:MAG: hypothetical protein JW755_11780 [Candidatus Aminicenantes bacterium]|nr:hypothetical protein [Candidatus Aminicenantes bacterium]
MRNTINISKTITTSILLLILIFINPLYAQLEIGTEYNSSYIWRGFDLNPRKKPILSPWLAYNLDNTGIYMELCGIFSFQDKELNEFDFILSYTYPGLKQIQLTGGIIHYGWYFSEDFHFRYDTSHEIFIQIEVIDLPVRPSFNIYYDFTNGDGFYTELEAEHSFQVWKTFGINVYGSLGYNAGQWLPKEADPGFSDLNLKIEFPVSIGSLQIKSFVQETFVLLEALGRKSYFFWGLSLYYSLD